MSSTGNQWKLSCPVHNLAELEQALSDVPYVDIAIWDFKHALGLGSTGYPGRLIQALMPYKDRISSAHLCNEYDVIDGQGRSLFEQDIELLASLAIGIGVLHLRTPCGMEDVQRQFAYLQRSVHGHGVTIAIENLPDTRDRSRGFRWIQDPVIIADYLQRERTGAFGLCLDTSHAICRGYTCWESSALASQLVAIHLSASVNGQDLHQEISAGTDAGLLKNVARVVRASPNEVVIIAEQRDFAGSLRSLRYLKNSGWL